MGTSVLRAFAGVCNKIKCHKSAVNEALKSTNSCAVFDSLLFMRYVCSEVTEQVEEKYDALQHFKNRYKSHVFQVSALKSNQQQHVPTLASLESTKQHHVPTLASLESTRQHHVPTLPSLESSQQQQSSKLTETEFNCELPRQIPHTRSSVPTFNLAAYANESPTLQELVKLGVNLHKLEKKKNVPEFILRLDFDRDIKQYIRFLHDVGVGADELGAYLTTNPFIFKEDMDDLMVRINYLESKGFSKPMVTRVVSKNPYWLLFSTQRIDRRLGHFQKAFHLTGSEVRTLAVKQPRLITYSMNNIKINTFVIKEELGFNEGEMKMLLLEKPRLWIINQVSLKRQFDFVHNEMKISHEQLMKHPEVLTSREFRTKQRHLFLEAIGRAQYNPTIEGYVPLDKLVSGTDVEFCQNIAKTSIETFNTFLKTL